MKKSRRHQHEERRKSDLKVKEKIKWAKEMCVYLSVPTCLSGYVEVTAEVYSRYTLEGKYQTALQ